VKQIRSRAQTPRTDEAKGASISSKSRLIVGGIAPAWQQAMGAANSRSANPTHLEDNVQTFSVSILAKVISRTQTCGLVVTAMSVV